MKSHILALWTICLICGGFSSVANAQTYVSGANQPNIAPPEAVVSIQDTQDSEIEYMIENYSQPELAQYTVEMYKTAVRNAKINGNELPPKPTREILNDKQKIGEYLRSFYKFTY